jgi:hypothetical protein
MSFGAADLESRPGGLQRQMSRALLADHPIENSDTWPADENAWKRKVATACRHLMTHLINFRSFSWNTAMTKVVWAKWKLHENIRDHVPELRNRPILIYAAYLRLLFAT